DALAAGVAVEHGMAVPWPLARLLVREGTHDWPERVDQLLGHPGGEPLGARREQVGVVDTDDLGAEVAEQHRAVRTRPHHGEVEHPYPFERQTCHRLPPRSRRRRAA